MTGRIYEIGRWPEIGRPADDRDAGQRDAVTERQLAAAGVDLTERQLADRAAERGRLMHAQAVRRQAFHAYQATSQQALADARAGRGSTRPQAAALITVDAPPPVPLAPLGAPLAATLASAPAAGIFTSTATTDAAPPTGTSSGDPITTPTTPTRGPLGLPVWAWIGAAALGVYLVTRPKRGAR